MGKIIGIDLGTTKSVVAIYENDQANILSNKKGERITASFVARKKKTKEWLVGSAAKAQVALNPANSFYGVKRLIGRKFNDPEVAKMQELASYKIIPQPGVPAAEADAWLEIEGEAMSPVEISAKVLADLKATAEDRLGETITQAVITVPAYFNDAQRKATRDAGAIAGLKVERIINEPTSAALAYGADQTKDTTVAVYDLGGGTFDVSILQIDHDEEDGNVIEVISTAGDTFLGGENFDEIITRHFIDQINNDDEIEMTIDLDDPASVAKHATTIQTVRAEAEKAKISLSEQDSVDIVFGFLGMDDNNMPVAGYNLSLTRIEMEDMLRDLIEKTKIPCQQALDDAGLTLADIDEVLLVGSQTRMPLVKETVAQFYGKPPRQDIDPSEIVAAGAATQAAVLSGDVDNVLLMDVIPLSIGVKTKGDTMKFMIKRNQSIPTKITETFFTAEDDQEDILVQVYQGERPKASDNKLLGEFCLEPLPPAPAGLPIEVNMEIDADGVLQVSAECGGRKQSVTIKANGGLSDADIERMLKDAEENAERDRLYQERKETILNTDVMLKKAAKDPEKDYFQSATEELQNEFKAAVEELTAARQTEDVPAMKAGLEKLTTVRRSISEAFMNAANNNEEEATNDADASVDTPDTDAPEASTNEEATPAPKQKKNGTDGPANG